MTILEINFLYITYTAQFSIEPQTCNVCGVGAGVTTLTGPVIYCVYIVARFYTHSTQIMKIY